MVLTTDHPLLETFYGRDNLVLMCGAKRFRINQCSPVKSERVSFWVGPYIVTISEGREIDYKGVRCPYNLLIYHRKSKETLCHRDFLFPEHVRSTFTIKTRYVLEF